MFGFGHEYGFNFGALMGAFISFTFVILMIVIVLGVLFLLVRFLLVATRAAQLYVAAHEPPKPVAPAPAPAPAAPAAPPAE